jgi:hypothetical protein
VRLNHFRTRPSHGLGLDLDGFCVCADCSMWRLIANENYVLSETLSLLVFYSGHLSRPLRREVRRRRLARGRLGWR